MNTMPELPPTAPDHPPQPMPPGRRTPSLLRYALTALHLALIALGLKLGYDFGYEISGRLVGVLAGVNTALFCSLIFSFVVERLGRVAKQAAR